MSKKWNSDRLLSLSAMSISFITLLIFIYQTNLMSKQNYLSILPYLSLTSSDNSAGNTFELALENHGVGPAIIESVTLEYKGKRYQLADYEGKILTVLRDIVPALDSIQSFSSSSIDKGMAIPANTSYQVLSVGSRQEDYILILTSLNRLLEEGFRYEIVYRSILEERWMIHTDSEGPERMD